MNRGREVSEQRGGGEGFQDEGGKIKKKGEGILANLR